MRPEDHTWNDGTQTPARRHDPDAGDGADDRGPDPDGPDSAPSWASRLGTLPSRPKPPAVVTTTHPVWEPRTQAWRAPGESVVPMPAAPGPASAQRAGIIGGVVGAVLATLLTVAALSVMGATRPVATERVMGPQEAIAPASGSIPEMAEQARAWVVNINVSGQQAGAFGSRVFQGTGSGVIIRSDGHILTNAHVVEEARELEVTLRSGDRLPGEVVGVDTDTDVAVIKVDRDELPPAVMGSARDLRVGELAIAIGSPLGLEQTLTVGVVSALGRTVPRPGDPPLIDMIQTDAAVTQGSSGGALIDARGALVGINTAIAASPQVGAEGIAFAIPIDIAKAVADELIATGRATHPWLGIAGTDVDADTARRFGVDQGAVVVEIAPGGPAQTAGMELDDVVVRFDGEQIETMQDLVVAIRLREVGETVTIQLVRDGATHEIDVTLGERPRQ